MSAVPDSQSSYLRWQAPASRVVFIHRRVLEAVHREIQDSFAAVPRRGAETGGILLGHHGAGETTIEDCEPVPSEHRFGPSYRLSDADQEALRETLAWFRSGAHTGLSVVGFYRSHTRPEFALSDEDVHLFRTHFPDPDHVFLLIQPSRTGPSLADFFFWRDARIEEASRPSPFPFLDTPPLESAAAAAQSDAPVSAAPPRAPAPVLPPLPPHRALRSPTLELEPPPKRTGFWLTVAAMLAIAGSVLGYLSIRSESPTAPKTRQAAARQPSPPVEPAKPSPLQPASPPAPEAADRTVQEEPPRRRNDPAEIHALLERWAGALRRGDAQDAAACYAPRVAPYFTRASADRDLVRQSIRSSIARNGRPDIYRVTDIQIGAIHRDRAVATFRKHWQSSGYRKFAGEERERVRLVRREGDWQIASEQEEKIYWVHSSR